ncbi:MAG: TetR/AcrR family transcriptional regulator [Candidatus Paraprevotella stercoravium]|jgi:AcrR family transcriptional regulator|uniref:TetR/AcrR family transcriptional regulator n=2 Tax=Bacteroidales TaxID=171549 RepID=A0ABT7U368_9BACE|nr:TetR/AcrR family transcriptional regulator [Candidatus Paraprevotella stercoravium]MDM8144959.1 TetR/AcrR family transcriptional regulator [Bacteroides eggerthii]
MAVSKTKLKLVEVARVLFAKNGLEATTMNDIAVASKKGRRTLYTYFKNKEELYYAVIETELDRLTQKMAEVATRNIPPEEKLLELIFAHLNLIKEAVFRNGNLRAEFFRDIWMVEKVRKNFDLAEINLIQKVITEGIQRQIFEIPNVLLVSDIIHYCVKGLEVPYIYGRLGEGLNQETCKPMVQALLNKALKKL